MSGSLFSEQWYRVAEMKPRLRAQVKVQRQRWRDQLWYILSDDATGRHHRINDAAYQFIGRCDGRQTVNQVWDVVLEALGDGAPTQDETIDLLAKLYDGELLQFDRNPEVDILFLRQSERAFRRQKAMVNPLAFHLPLGDPTPWLTRLQPIGRLLFRPVVFWLWLIAILVAMIATATHWDILQTHAEHHMLTPRYLALTWICFPLIKTVHEIGHGLAVRHWSGEVHEFGISLLVLVPAPYVDATAASAFLGRGERVLVSASGIMVELGLAALAMVVWLNSEAGWTKDVAFVVMTIGSVSTLLFNSNPLLRFDGYYILTDLLDLPNLSSRSNTYWLHLLRRHLLRLRSETPQIGQGERKWLLFYAPLSYLYRVLISLQILFWIGSKWFVLGVLAGVY
ncbi:MAG TPA: peptidase M50, partial [Accumulibacter sp.]|nr:peptidase M50 [Accumulibacter sp.]